MVRLWRMALVLTLAALPLARAAAVEPIKIGLSVSLTGGLAANGLQVLLATYGPDGEWTKPRMLVSQFQHIVGNDVEQFKDTTRQVILWPPEYKSGEMIYPFADARK
jgi:hypothetical protein